MSTSTKPAVKKNELKIFKTRKEIKEAENEGDKTSPANGSAAIKQPRTPLVHTKRASTTSIGSPSANNGIVRKANTSLTNKSAKEASPDKNTILAKPVATSKTEKKSASPAASKPSSRLSNTTSSKVGPKVTVGKSTTPATIRRKSLLPTTTASAKSTTSANKSSKTVKQEKQPSESAEKEESPTPKPPSPAKPIAKKARSLSPVKSLKRILGGKSSLETKKKLATSAEDLNADNKLRCSGRMSEVSGAVLTAVPSKSSKPVAQGTDSEERVSQTIQMEKNQINNEGFAEAIFKPKSRIQPRSSDCHQNSIEATNKSRETAGDECLGVAANSRDLFVYLNPHKANASVSLNLVRSKAKKMISNSTSDLDKKANRTSSSSPNHQSRSVSSQQLNGKTVSSSDLLHAKFNQLKKTQPLSEEDLSDSLTSSTLTYAIDGIGSCRILPKFPRDSPPLSVHQEEEVESQQLQSTSQQIIGKMENNKSTTSSKLADKLSKSFFDLTQGSQDRLQKWKSKLQKQCSQHNNHHHQRSLRGEGREKDTSEPPPRNRKMCTLGGAVPASSEMEILVDWTTSKPIIGESEQESAYSRHPRPLRSTHSASNAMNLVNKLSSPASSDNGLKPANNKILTSITSTANPLHKSNSLREPYTIRSPAANVNSPVSSPASNYSSATMEHRTLRQREQQQQFNDTAAATIGSTACKNFQQLLQSIEGYSAKNSYPPPDRQNRNSGELPPPARIMPFSGIKPQDNGIIHRPIAFRPVANGQNGSSNGNVLEHRQSVGSATFSTSNSSHSNGAAKKGVSSNIEHHKQTLKDHSRSIGNLVSATVTAPSRPGNNTNSNRSSALQNASTSHSASSSHLYNSDHPPAKPTAQHQQNGHHNNLKVGNEENDYDTVPEFVDHKCFSEGDSIGNNSETYSLIYPYQNTTNNISGKPLVGLVNEGNKRGSMFQTGNSSIGSRNTSSHSSGSSTNNHSSAMIHSPIASKKLVNGSQQQQQSYRHSSGVHITPSPSDSGIVDYETLIRDKENELSTVRHAMEQNEEVLIRVYQEKERQFKEQISNLKQKLQDTQQHESTLYQQLCQSDDIRQQLQNSVRMLTEDRNAQQRKCQRMEKELDLLRNKLDNLEKLQKAKPCPSKCSCNADNNSVDGSVYENGGGIADKHRPPVPAPRTFKDANGPNQELRSEVDDLRGEICNLRDQLNNQIHFFTDERRRWEQERQQQNSQHTSPPADVLPNVVSKSSSKPTPLSALYGAPYTKRGEVIMSTDRLI